MSRTQRGFHNRHTIPETLKVSKILTFLFNKNPMPIKENIKNERTIDGLRPTHKAYKAMAAIEIIMRIFNLTRKIFKTKKNTAERSPTCRPLMAIRWATAAFINTDLVFLSRSSRRPRKTEDRNL